METDEILKRILEHVHDISIMLYFTFLAMLIGVDYAIAKVEGISLWFVPVAVLAIYIFVRYLINH
jgi:hypothetical protein